MKKEDEFAAWIARAVLSSKGEDIQVEVLDDLIEKAEIAGSLEAEIEAAREASKRPGDFGAEFVGALLLPLLIEAGKQLWVAYLKKLTEKAGEKLSALTVDGVKMVAYRAWSGEEEAITAADYEKLLRAAAEKQCIPQDQINQLVAELSDPEMRHALRPT